MSTQVPTSDGRLLDLLRASGSMGVADLARQVEVTPTAIRQRLMRLMAQGLVQREAVRNGRGRPRHLYRLTDKGLRLTGSNFADLALALWREIGLSGSEELQQEMVRRIARALASEYAGQVQGDTIAERMQSLRELLAQRRIPVSVKDFAHQLVITAHACPYPKLAEQDRRVCAMEQMLFSELLGQDVELTQCRLDGGADCCFLAGHPRP
ncbi:MAG: helix-turn-helix transcriptional regulator [Planctomycetota bacterium]|jgi:predicted ArsR family transcriptional regulator